MSPSKDSRGLWVWFALNTVGLDKVKDHLRESITFATFFKAELTKNPKFKVLPTLLDMPLVLFKVKDHDNDQTSKFLNQLNSTKKIFLVSSVIEGEEIIWLSVGT